MLQSSDNNSNKIFALLCVAKESYFAVLLVKAPFPLCGWMLDGGKIIVQEVALVS